MRGVLIRLREDDGVSAVVVVLSLTAIFGAALLSVDAGSVWKTRRDLVTDTDAAALAAARYVVNGRAPACDDATFNGEASGAGAEARYVLGENEDETRMVGFELSPLDGDCTIEAGHVRVDGRLIAPLAFGGIFGIDDVDTFSSSTAQYGPIVAATGVRPIGLCDKSEHFQEWWRYLDGDTSTYGTGPGHPDYGLGEGRVVHRIGFGPGSSPCGTGAGNWDWLDFNGNNTPNGTTALREWFYAGYQKEVSLGDDDGSRPRDCNPEIAGSDGCSPKTGAGGGSFIDSLEYLRDNNIEFPIVVYDRVVDRRDPEGCNTPPPWSGSGDNAVFCHVAFLMVRIHGWSNITGQLSDRSYLDLEFTRALWVGAIGRRATGSQPSVMGVGLCGGNYGTTTDVRCDV